jgi:hypothetical protein
MELSMRNQKVSATPVKGFDKRKTSVTKPMPESGKPGKRFGVGQDQAALRRMFINNARKVEK